MRHPIAVLITILFVPMMVYGQYNINRLITIGRSALYFEDYVLSMQYFNQAIIAKPYLYEPWFLRAIAKYNLDDFPGCERDCNKALEINPYIVNARELRGLARIMQEKFDEAIEDYSIALKYDPQNKVLWHNRALCRIQNKDYDEALSDLDTMTIKWTKYARAYLMKAEVYLLKQDTTLAIDALDRCIELDPYDFGAWSARATISLSRQEWEEAEGYLNRAIHLSPKQSSNYINRALARVNLNNLRGAMNDYDTALDLDKNNFLGHYNRGLLRAQVGDNNRAIEDFDFVLNLEPDNIMALFNRALLLEETGDIKGAIRDMSLVIDEFPNFWTGLSHRADCYRKLGMDKEAEEDEFSIYKAQLYKHLYGTQPRLDKEQIRKRSEIDPNKYNQLVVSDEQDVIPEYESDYRGKVQNRKVEMEFLPMYELSYEKDYSEINPYISYDLQVENFNRSTPNEIPIHVSCTSATLDEASSYKYFHYIDSLSEAMITTEDVSLRLALLLRRSISYSVIKNLENAIEDLSEYIRCDSTFSLAWWQRGVCQAKFNEFNASHGNMEVLNVTKVITDFTEAIQLNPTCACLYYNRGNAFATQKDFTSAINDYSSAINLDRNLAEAYYNRGLAQILLGRITEGITDLSKAGELGLYTAYSVIKKYSSK